MESWNVSQAEYEGKNRRPGLDSHSASLALEHAAAVGVARLPAALGVPHEGDAELLARLPAGVRASAVIELQRTQGNAFVQRLAILCRQRTLGNRAVSGLLREEASAAPVPGAEGVPSETLPADGQEDALTADDLAAIASPLKAAETGLLGEDPLAGAQLMPGLEAAIEQLEGGQGATPPQAAAQVPTGAPLAPSQARVQRSVDRPALRQLARATVMRQPAPASAPPAKPAAPMSVDAAKRVMSNLLEFIVNKIGAQPYDGPRGGEKDPIRWCALVTDWLHRTFSPVLTQPLPQAQGDLAAKVRAEFELFLRRLAVLRGFYNSMLPQPAFAGKPTGKEAEGAMPAQKRPEDPRRMQIAANGLADLGKVRAKEESEGRRIGHEQLKVIFDTAWPTHVRDGVSDSLIERKRAGERLTHGAKKDPATGKYPPEAFYKTDDVLPSWCGVGATYWAKKVDPAFPDWTMGVGVSGKLAKRSKRELPMVGDVAIAVELGHHGIVTWVDPDAKPPQTDAEWGKVRIKTVEANMNGGQIVETPSGHDTLAWATTGIFDPFGRK